MHFTFYGDLLGIGSAYKLGAKTAYDKLNAFYNESFRTLVNPRHKVEMYSDSLLVIGDDASDALTDIALLFANLVRKGLLLRGAMVKRKLTYQARVTRQNFQKHLPNDDTLARAVGLEKSQRGSRFLIEPTLASDLLQDNPDWLSQEGYIRSISMQGNNALRRICPTPDNNSFEYLYYWTDEIESNEYARRIKDLKDVMIMYDKPTREHFEETIGVIERAKHRHKTTNERLGVR
jgi:hypothetical protein